MLAASQSTKKFERFYKKKPKAQESVSLDDLACLVRRLSVQVDDLEHWVEESNQKAVNASATAIAATTVTLSQSSSSDINFNNNGNNSNGTKRDAAQNIIVDPWASHVPQNYGVLLQRLEDMESQKKCPNECCAAAASVSSADGVPWPEPIEPFRPSPSYLDKQQNIHEILDIHYSHWCTLMRCLPLMDSITSTHVKTVGLYAMREILKSKANQRREESTALHPASTTRLRDSLSYLSIHDKHRYTPDWSSPAPPPRPTTTAIRESETKIAIETAENTTPALLAPPVPPKMMSSTETTTTPTPSSFPSPTTKKYSKKKLQKWLQLKKNNKKVHSEVSSGKFTSMFSV